MKRWSEAAVVAVALGLAACTTSSAAESESAAVDEARLDLPRAQVLASVLHSNYVAGGAEFRVDADFPASGDIIALDGRIDWTSHTGSATVSATGAESFVTDVVWNTDHVFERVPALDNLIGFAPDGSALYVARPPAAHARALDSLLALVTGLATATPDNPQLIQQEPTARFLGEETIDNTPVDVYKYQSSEYRIDNAGHLQRVDIEPSDGDGRRVSVRIVGLGAQHVDPIAADRTISYDAIHAVYPPTPS